MTRSLAAATAPVCAVRHSAAATCWLWPSFGCEMQHGAVTISSSPGSRQEPAHSTTTRTLCACNPPTPAVSVLLNPKTHTLGTLANPQPCIPFPTLTLHALPKPDSARPCKPSTLHALPNPQPCTPFQEPSIYRLYEAIMHNGDAIKALVNEEFGDGTFLCLFCFCWGGRGEGSQYSVEGGAGRGK